MTTTDDSVVVPNTCTNPSASNLGEPNTTPARNGICTRSACCTHEPPESAECHADNPDPVTPDNTHNDDVEPDTDHT
jgi:hypothetical protein